MPDEPEVAASDARATLGWRRGVRIALGTVCTMLVLGSIAARSDSRVWPFEVFSNLPVQFVLLGTLALVAAVLLRARTSIVLAVVCLALNIGPIVSALRSDQPPADPESAKLTFRSLNAQSGHIDVDRLRDDVATERPDVMIVLDPAPQQRGAYDRAPAGYEVYATKPQFRSQSEVARTILWTRIPLTRVRHPVDRAFGPSAAEFRYRMNGELSSFLAIGSDSPTTSARASERNRILDAAARWSRQEQMDIENVIVMGDFNATRWSPVVERLKRNGRLHDSLDGFGIQPSWPTSNPFFLVPIDNALLSDEIVATDRHTGPGYGSLHRSLTVTVAASRVPQ
jgi:endonuclease/exonuclease/phosphatase (EEP) superfamily protein YafD